jgi:D-glycero-beta-D-manno-heptose-7-phosphate kinase
MKILVIGDSCVDRFVYCDIDRLCPEAPVPVLNPVKRTENPGMAGNVVENLRSLGADVDLLTNSKKISKTRYVDTKTGQMIMRLDESDSCERFDVNQISKDCEYDAVIVSDYNKGFLTELDMETICGMDCFKFLDSKRKFNDFKDGTWCHLFDFIKINSVEYEQNKKVIHSTKPSIKLYNKCIITRGPRGCEYNNKIYPTTDVPVKDVSGAGDTFMAALVYEYIKSQDINKAIEFSQKCTTNVVQKPGVALIDKNI